MHPLLIAVVTVAVFFGLVISFHVGWHVDDWVKKIFSYRMRVTPTHLVIEPATAEEIVSKYEEKLQLEQPCHECYQEKAEWLYHEHLKGMKWGVGQTFRDEVDRLRAEEEDAVYSDNIKYLNLAPEPEPSTRTMQEVFDSLNQEQKDTVYALIGMALEEHDKPDEGTPPYYDILDL